MYLRVGASQASVPIRILEQDLVGGVRKSLSTYIYLLGEPNCVRHSLSPTTIIVSLLSQKILVSLIVIFMKKIYLLKNKKYCIFVCAIIMKSLSRSFKMCILKTICKHFVQQLQQPFGLSSGIFSSLAST